uniref:Uncharacterized protein n=1 Tax=Arundo donax TaxID=35708 RepID=A0A0A9PZ17_ARUDO
MNAHRTTQNSGAVASPSLINLPKGSQGYSKKTQALKHSTRMSNPVFL